MKDDIPALQALLQRSPSETIRLGLTPLRRLLARLGNPHNRLRCVHVAGTNGKGSVIAFLEAILMAAGIPVAAFTSPHLERFNERLRVQGTPIDDHTLDAVLTEVMQHDPYIETTFFELTTAAAFFYFTSLPLFSRGNGVVLLETGLGGRLDATNVVTPLVGVITSIGLDHMDFLGDTIASIAREKGGIFKPGVPALAAPAHPGAARTLIAMAQRQNTPLALAGREFRYRRIVNDPQQAWLFRDRQGTVCLPAPALPGQHQYANAALAVGVARELARQGCPITRRSLRSGLTRAVWPGRLERFPGPPPIWLDGAHNPAAIGTLVQFLRDPASGGSNCHTALVFSVLNNKDGATMAALLTNAAHIVFTVRCGGSRGHTLHALCALWPDSGPPVIPCDSVPEALAKARTAAGPAGRVVVAGSLYLVGEARSLLC
ncbi:MAG: bifunctional folylpolyglutamate synthase/dihydrofolate synthase [Magnetococcales bacterium]|nr:bifunctional folylpolyglutamate synthase/dihydrofolate synthase [Magnetococcales bacterium]